MNTYGRGSPSIHHCMLGWSWIHGKIRRNEPLQRLCNLCCRLLTSEPWISRFMWCQDVSVTRKKGVLDKALIDPGLHSVGKWIVTQTTTDNDAPHSVAVDRLDLWKGVPCTTVWQPYSQRLYSSEHCVLWERPSPWLESWIKFRVH